MRLGFEVKRNEFLDGETGEKDLEWAAVRKHADLPSKLILKSIILAVNESGVTS